jgi:DNA relaxase NicK
VSNRLSGVLIDSGVDYLTATAKQDHNIERLAEIGRALAESQHYDGFIARPCSFSGYEGMQVGHVYYGERQDGCILRLGSYVAQSHYKRVVQHADNITRIDLQCTYRTGPKPMQVIARHFRQMRNHNTAYKKAPGVSLFIGGDDSRTLYSGSRASDCYGRIYDKGLESGQPQFAGSVRYEVEFKGKRALAIAIRLHSGHSCSLCFARSVLSFFQERGCCNSSLCTTSACFDIDMSSNAWVHQTDIQDVLKWLDRAVRPSVTRLLHRNLQADVFRVLGITSEVVQHYHEAGGPPMDQQKPQEVPR